MSRPVTALALLGAAGISAIALNDAVTFALTGQYSAASDEFGVNPLYVASGIVHGLAYLAFTAVLHTRRAQVDGGSRFRRVVRSVLTVSLLTLAAGMLGGTAVSVATGEVLGGGVFSVVAGIGFLLMFIGSVVLGFALLQRRGLRLAAWTLVAVLPSIGFVILLDIFGSAWAHPAYAEVLASFGLAFIGLAPRDETAAPRHETAAHAASSHKAAPDPVRG
jgi:hypothetical protein